MALTEKKVYVRPEVRVTGTIDELTLANGFRTISDGVFVSTPRGPASLGS